MLFRGWTGRDELKYIAMEIGHRVEYEIASSRFIEKANQLEKDIINETKSPFAVWLFPY
jgi:hypothetical protein